MRAEENEKLCLIGPETPMGKALRHFWTPGFLSSDLPKPGGAPIRVRLFGEDLVAFRGEDGVIGVLDEYCPHRGVSLSLARNEDCALRCIFHGWKMDRHGTVLDMPNADDDRAKKHYKARAYPVEEAHGIVWIYMGDPKKVPPRPRYQWETVPPENCLVMPVDLDCNWVQSLEGLVDTTHTGVLHEDALKILPASINGDIGSIQTFKAAKLEMEATDFGFHCAAIRQSETTDERRLRLTAYIAPFTCLIPPDGQAFLTVPMDDGRTRFYNIWWSQTERLDSGEGYDSRIKSWGLTDEILDATGMRSVNPVAGQEVPRNRFTQNRAAMESGESFAGLPGLTAEDAAVAVTMGVITKRDKEHLLPADAAVVLLRKMLLKAADDAEAGKVPAFIGGQTPSERIDAVSATLKPGDDWRALVPQHVKI